ncbi:MAG: hypothetical protein KBS81_07335 [Spirochaetales bacterium]|nr:hypothetical protein [Candidatus Physcosoma equi]
MKKLIVILSLVLLAAFTLSAATVSYDSFLDDAVASLSRAIGKDKKVAVMDFNADSETFKARLVADLEKNLVNNDCIVLNRSSMDKVISELEFQTSGLVDDDEAVSIGHMMGAELIITGSAKNMASSYHVEIQLIDVESSLTRRQLSYDLKYNQELKNMIYGTDSVGNQKIAVGIRLGGSMSLSRAHEDMVGDMRPKTEPSSSFVPTMELSYSIMDNFAVQAELTYYKNNGVKVISYYDDYSGYTFDIDVQYSSMDPAVLFSYRVIEKPVLVSLFAGAYASLPVSDCSIEYRVAELHKDVSGAVTMEGLAYGFLAGFDVGIPAGPGRVTLDARYFNDLANLNVHATLYDKDSNPMPIQGGVIYRRGFTVSAGYTLSIGG